MVSPESEGWRWWLGERRSRAESPKEDREPNLDGERKGKARLQPITLAAP